MSNPLSGLITNGDIHLDALLKGLTNSELLIVARKINLPITALDTATLEQVVEAATAVTWVKGKRTDASYTWEDALESDSVSDLILAALDTSATDETEDVDPS